MDWISFLQNNIGEFIILIGGSGILYWRETKRGKKIDNDGKVMEEWKEMYHEKEKKCTEKDQIIKDKDDKIEQLRKKISSLYDERSEFMAKREFELKQKDSEILELKMKQGELQWNECRVNGCDRREPPRDRKCLTCQDCKE